MKASTLVVPCVCALMTACAPSVNVVPTQYPKDEATVVSPTKDQVPFALRSSTLLLTPAGASSSATPSSSGAVRLVEVCEKPAAPPAPPSSTSTSTPPAPATPQKPKWESCVDSVQVVATPVRGNIYVANAGRNTTLSATSMDTDPLLLKAVSVNQTATASGTLTNMGTDVAAGFATGNPWGIALGGLAAAGEAASAVGGVGAIYDTISHIGAANTSTNQNLVFNLLHPAPPPPPGTILQKVVCPDITKQIEDQTKTDGTGYDNTANLTPTLTLPITIPATITDSPNSAADMKQCWEPLPSLATPAPGAQRFLWFYRILTAGTDLPPISVDANGKPLTTSVLQTDTGAIHFPPTLQRAYNIPNAPYDNMGGTILKVGDYFTPPSSGSPGTPAPLVAQVSSWLDLESKIPNAFPTSACRAVEVDIAWWQELDKPAPADPSPAYAINDPAAPKYKAFKITVADPRFVQLVNIQKGEVINFSPVCGAYATTTPSSTTTTDTISAFVQAASTVMKAQQAAATSSK